MDFASSRWPWGTARRWILSTQCFVAGRFKGRAEITVGNWFVRLISGGVGAQFICGLCRIPEECTRCRFGTWFGADLVMRGFFSWDILGRGMTNAAKFILFFWECSASVWELASFGALVELEGGFGWQRAWFGVKSELKYLVKQNYKWNPNTMDLFKRKFTIQSIRYISYISYIFISII